MAMSTLFSRINAMTSRAERYRLPERTSNSRRGEFDRLGAETIRCSRWKGRRMGPRMGGPGGVVMVISDERNTPGWACGKATEANATNTPTAVRIERRTGRVRIGIKVVLIFELRFGRRGGQHREDSNWRPRERGVSSPGTDGHRGKGLNALARCTRAGRRGGVGVGCPVLQSACSVPGGWRWVKDVDAVGQKPRRVVG